MWEILPYKEIIIILSNYLTFDLELIMIMNDHFDLIPTHSSLHTLILSHIEFFYIWDPFTLNPGPALGLVGSMIIFITLLNKK